MDFIRNDLDSSKIVDNVFRMVDMQSKDKDPSKINATIGSLYNENGELVALDSVFRNYDEISDRNKAKYAQSFKGNTGYIDTVNKWILQNADFKLSFDSIATIGGTGAISMALRSFVDEEDEILAPNIAWASYRIMARQFNLIYGTYNLLKNDEFDLEDFKNNVSRVLEKQDKLLIIINDPCHNPTGLSMGYRVWHEVIDFLNQFEDKQIIILNDIAYIDYSYDLENSRKYLENFNHANKNILLLIAFSISKSFTSYGMRCGALFVAHQDEETKNKVMNTLEKMARATWSNIPNAAMVNFDEIINHHLDEYLNEKQGYIDLLRERSSIFLKEAKEVGLKHYRYDEGFFISVMTNKAQEVHDKLIKDHIYTVKVENGIRLAICSLPIDKVKGLALRIKKVMD